MKKLITIIGITCTASLGYSQLNGTYNIPGAYPTLAAAINDLNLQGVSGPTTFSLAAGFTETAPMGGYTITATGTAVNPISILATGGATITAYTGGSGTPGSATNQDFIFRFVGNDYFTIDGLTIIENPVNSGNALMEAGIAFVKNPGNDGCHYNLIQNCVIVMSYDNNANGSGPSVEGSKGILFINAATNSLTTTYVVSSPSGSHSYNTITTNTIANSNYGIFLGGYTDVSPYANADYNNSITNNVIINFGGATSATNPAAGIRTQNQYNLLISGNLLDNNYLSSGAYHPTTLRGIFLQNASNANVTVTNNTLTVVSGATTSQLSVIENASGGSGTNNLVNISNNQLINCGFLAGTSGSFYGIYNNTTSTASLSVIGNTITGVTSGVSAAPTNFIYISGTGTGASHFVNLSNNSITNSTLSTTGMTYLMYNSNATPNHSIVANFVNNIIKTATSGGLRGYYNFGLPSGGTVTLSNNLFSNIICSGSSAFSAIYHGTSSSQTVSITSNTIQNCSAGSSTSYGVYYSFGSPYGTISDNLINNINANGTLYGLYHGSGTSNVNNNLISTLTTSATSIYGAYFSSASTNFYNNKLVDITSYSTTANANGLYVNSGTTFNVYNNIIGDIFAPSATGTNVVNGIYINGGSTVNLYYNTIRLNSSSTGTDFGSSAIYASTTPTLLLQNNIFINNSTPNGTGKTVAYRRSSTTISTYNSASNKNIFYAGVPGAQNLIFSDGTNDYQTIAMYKSAVSPADIGSNTENTSFLSTTPSNANYLHVDGSISSLTESQALSVPSISVDIDGDIRQGFPGYIGTGTSPDIGADEYNGISALPPNDVGVQGAISPANVGCYTSAENVIVTVKNYGTNTQNSFPVTAWISGPVTNTLNGAYSGNLAPGATANVTLGIVNMSAAGTYTFKVFTGLTGDGDISNDTIIFTRVVAPVASLPQQVDFTGFNGSNLPTVFSGWYEANGTVPTGTTSAWLNQTGLGTTTNITARINLYSNFSKEWIIGPKLVPNANTFLKFDAAVTDWNSVTTSDVMGSDDAVYVMVSTDCGNTFTPIYTISVLNNLPPTLTQFIIPLGSYSNNPIIIGFYATDGTTNDIEDYDFHLDNINIYDAYSDDLAATALLSPNTSANCFGVENVIVNIDNIGLNSATNFTVTAILSGANNGTLTSIYTNTLNSSSSATINMGSFNMSTVGNYTITTYITYPADSNNSNDTIIATYNYVALPFPFLETFDAVAPLPGLPANWTSDNSSTAYDFTVRTTGSSIQHGAGNPPTQGITADLYSGNSTSWFETPFIGPLPSQNVELGFVYRIVDYSGYANPGGTPTIYSNNDSLKIYVSTNCGASWNLVGFINGANHTTSNLFAQKVFCLGNTYAGQNVKLRFEAKWSSGDYWLDIDSISLNVPTVSISITNTNVCQNSNLIVTANATGATGYTWNPGGATGSTFTVNTSTTGTTVYTVDAVLNSSCVASSLFTITVNPNPSLTSNITPATSPGCANGSATVIAASSSTTGASWNWVPSVTTTSTSTSIISTALNGSSITPTQYTVTFTDGNGCSAVTIVTVSCVTGIENLSYENSINIYPNPSKGIFTIQSMNDIVKQVQIVDVLGKTIKEFEFKGRNVEVDMSNATVGIYYVKISDNGDNRIFKLIIQ